MSYLFTLYVRYHGDNLASYGILIGSTDEELNNKGLKRAEDIDPTLIDPSLIDAVKKKEQMESMQDDYEAMLRNAIMKSQNETFKLSKAGLVQETEYDHTPKTIINDYEQYGMYDMTSSSNMDFFDEVNRMGKYDPMLQNNFPW